MCVSQCLYCLWNKMCCDRWLRILICITAIIISTNGTGLDRLSYDDRMKQQEMDYGERLSSMEDGPTVLRDELDREGQLYSDYTFKGSAKPERLIGQVATAPQLLNQGKSNTPSTKCTTNQPIPLDLNNVPKSDDETQLTEDDTTPEPDINGDQDESLAPDDNGDATDATTDNGLSDENKVDGGGQNQDPAKDDDDDATVFTKKYFAPQGSYFPDHFIDDARK
ncbi:uncharacterized protein LOC134801860 isoform X2 [Cydia splendana]|uniref:uncharacterized protein LOC134801860 isoform X2 n=1 Tax=Cydia splendana TaxID=1100963 RepID=UPI00300CC908